jgi:hypothetical protein
MSETSFRLDVMPFVIATVGEFLALHYWLVLLDLDHFILANLVLWAGFLTERIAVITWIQRIYRPTVGIASQSTSVARKAVRLFVVTLTEILIWIVWLWLADEVDFWLAGAVLMVLMLAEHSMEMALMKKDRFWKYVGNARTIFFTVMEVAGGMAWLYLVRHDAPVWGALALIVGLGIEHVLQGRQLKPDPSKMMAAAA